jgi:hypothetical protein
MGARRNRCESVTRAQGSVTRSVEKERQETRGGGELVQRKAVQNLG